MTWKRKGRPTDHDKPYKKEYVKVSPAIVTKHQHNLKVERIVKAYETINYFAHGEKNLTRFDKDTIRDMAYEIVEML